jgi:hypothetical protein
MTFAAKPTALVCHARMKEWPTRPQNVLQLAPRAAEPPPTRMRMVDVSFRASAPTSTPPAAPPLYQLGQPPRMALPQLAVPQLAVP